MKMKYLLPICFLYLMPTQLVYAVDNDSTPGVSFSNLVKKLNNEGIGLKSDPLTGDFTTIEGIIGSLLPLLFVVAGIILLFMLIFGGFTLLTAATNPDRAQKGKQILTMALGGFLLIFTSIWIAQIIGFVFGIKIFEP